MPLNYVALLLLERSTEGLVALVLCEACGVRATPLERESAGPQNHHLQAPEWWLEVGEYLGILEGGSLEGDQPMNHPGQLASEDDQC